MKLFILYTYQQDGHGGNTTPTEECHAYLFMNQADAEAYGEKLKTSPPANPFVVAGSFGYMVLPLESIG